ncbi:MAG TPA: enoyl-CoA hydratase-related protein [Solirubrobacteraceae bacterium]|nr:enoyl-CoA hydratase-related protein [Solirubrobacteraceae bacterium]
MAYSKLSYGVDDGVATIALDDPDTRNALSDALLDDLLAALAAARDDAAVRCVVLASAHERVFSSGGDLAGFTAQAPLTERHVANDRFPRVFALIGGLGKPVICAVGGHALGGAVGLVLACDLVVASDRATFGTPEINVGLFPFMIAVLIARNVPRKTMTELLLLGERVDAEEARRIGIVNRVVPDGELDAAVAEWARALAAKSPLLMKLGKDALYVQQDMPLEPALAFQRAQLSIALASQDAQEGVAAFRERREPRWSGR